MKFNIAFTVLSLSSIFNVAECQTSKVNLLRGGGATTPEVHEANALLAEQSLKISDSSCMTISEEDQCQGSVDEDNVPCVWCKCSAIPSECLSAEQAKSVPAGVFDCSTPTTPEESKSSDIELDGTKTITSLNARNSVTDSDNSYNGKFMTYGLTDDVVDGEVCDPNSKSLSGYVDISGSQYDADGEDKHLFYWFFEKRAYSKKDEVADAAATPLILWLTGGPGCSSTLALLTENGPCSVSQDGSSTEINPYSWTETAHVLWLDQPAGVGYSYGKENDYNEEMISEDAYYFLQGFFEKHPEYSTSPLFVVGESYGGHYAPAIAHKVWTKNNMKTDESLLKINLAGLAVGNGLTNPIEQYKWYPEMAYNNSHGIRVVTEEVYEGMKEAVEKCIPLIEKCNEGDSFLNKFACQSAFIVCNIGETSPYQTTGLNPYDIRKPCGDHPLCYDFSSIEKWLNLDSTKEALHVKESSKWASCNMGINLKFHTDWMKDFSPYVADLINAGIPALIYAGDVDFICNYLGNKAWTLALDWDHTKEFNDAGEKEWGSHKDGSAAGLARTANGLTFLQVYDAGHMVPSDQPDVALKMIKNFVEGGSF
mmetsp:Transcript_1969/g.2664  ORF Transcript_1969/g.2664 Transcript_1969/m.2664 type:complete len:595 (-) Transcript_1969:175-1959(-)